MNSTLSRACAVVIVAGVSLMGCNSSQTTASGEANSATALPALHTKANTKELMNWILDPHADLVWAAVGSVVTSEGEQKTAPKTDAEWNAVRNAAATVAETGNLLLVAPHARDGSDWVAMTNKMIDDANKCVEAAEAKDIEGMFTAGGDLYAACTACHTKYVIGEPGKEKTK
jgi:hypothetical protein